MSDDRKDLPPVTSPNFLEKVREAVQTYLGNRGATLDRGITLRDLTESGLVTLRANFGKGSSNPIGGPGSLILESIPTSSGVVGGAYEPDFTKPPTPTGFAAIVSVSWASIQVTTDAQTYTVGNGHSKTILYGAKYQSGDALPAFSDSAVLTEFPGDVGSCPVDAASLYRLWVKWVSTDGIESDPAGGTNGLLPTTGALDDAAIVNLTATNIKSGAVTVGQYIMSYNFRPGVAGWRIDGNGTAELANAVIRGTVYATAGQIGGITIASNAVRAGQTAYNTGQGFHLGSDGRLSLGNSTGNRLTWDGTNLSLTGELNAATGTFAGDISAATGTFTGNVHGSQFTTGAYTGYAWPAVNNYGTYLGPGGLLMGNANNGKYFQLTHDGNLYAPGFSVVNGVMSISQANVINTLNIAGNAVTIPSSAFTAAAVNYNLTGVLQSLGFTSFGGPVFITATFQASLVSGSNAGSVALRRDGIQLTYVTTTTQEKGYAISFTDTPGAGYHTYDLFASNPAVTYQYSNRSLFTIEVKR